MNNGQAEAFYPDPQKQRKAFMPAAIFGISQILVGWWVFVRYLQDTPWATIFLLTLVGHLAVMLWRFVRVVRSFKGPIVTVSSEGLTLHRSEEEVTVIRWASINSIKLLQPSEPKGQVIVSYRNLIGQDQNCELQFSLMNSNTSAELTVSLRRFWPNLDSPWGNSAKA